MITAIFIIECINNVIRHLGRGGAKVIKAVGYKDRIYSRIIFYVTRILSSVGFAVVGIFLYPDTSLIVVNVISHQHNETSIADRSLVPKRWVVPIFVEGRFRSNAHRENAMTGCAEAASSHPYDPIPWACRATDARLTRGQRASTMKGIWRKTKIAIDHVDV